MPGKIDDRGPYWKEIRASVLADIGCCIFCGTTKGLCVHHLVPYRYTQDNRHCNLVPVCIGHHKRIEKITERLIAGVGAGWWDTIGVFLRVSLHEYIILARAMTWIRKQPA